MDWHRLFGLLLADFCTGLPFEVEVEVDLSKRKQRLDIVLLRKHPGPCSERFPDGLDDLTAYNLITFKSHQEPDGVYDVRWGTDFIRIVVVRNLPQEKHNALMHLFSAAAKDCRYGTENYRLRSSRTSSIVEELLAH